MQKHVHTTQVLDAPAGQPATFLQAARRRPGLLQRRAAREGLGHLLPIACRASVKGNGKDIPNIPKPSSPASVGQVRILCSDAQGKEALILQNWERKAFFSFCALL